MAGKGLMSGARYGLTPKFTLKIGHQTGRQAYTSWLLNHQRRQEAMVVRGLFRAAAYARTTIRRGMRKSGQPVTDQNRHNWASYRPSPPGRPPRYRRGGQTSGLRFVTFTRPSRENMRSIVGPQVFQTRGTQRVNFRIAQMQEQGGQGLVYLPVDPAQNPFWGQRGTQPWPFAWTPSTYPARPYVEPAIRPTMRQFPNIFVHRGE